MNNNQTSVQFGEVSYTVNEEDGYYGPRTYVVEVVRNGDLNSSSIVNLSLLGGTAIEGEDYSLNNQVYFDYGQSRQFVEIEVFKDDIIENPESFFLEIAEGYGPDNYVVGEKKTTQVNIVDNSPTVEFGAVSYTVNEEDGYYGPRTYVVEVVRNGDLNSSSIVNLSLLGGTAIEGEDYSLNNQVYFDYGQSRQFVEIEVFKDDIIENPESFFLEIAEGYGPDNYVVGEKKTTQVNIVDNSPTVEFGAVSYTVNEEDGYYGPRTYVVEVVRNGDLNSSSIVNLNLLGGTAIEGEDYSLNNQVYFDYGQSRQFVEIEVFKDDIIENPESFFLEIAEGYGPDNYVVGEKKTTQVNIVDNSPTVEFGAVSYTVNEEDGYYGPRTYVVEVVRNGDLNSSSIVNLSLLGGTAIEGEDYSLNNQVYFDYGQSRQFVEIEVFKDDIIENPESFFLEIAEGYGPDNYVVGEKKTTQVNIVDNSPTVEFGAVSYTVNEEDGYYGPRTYVVEVVRNGDLNSSSIVNLNLLGGTAIEGEDYSLNNQVYFDYGQSRQFVEIEVFKDDIIENPESFFLEIAEGYGPDNYVVGEKKTTQVNIVDNSPTEGTGTTTVEFGAVSYTLNEDQGFSYSSPYYNPDAGYTYVVELVRTGDLTNFSSVNLNVLDGTAIQGQDYDFSQNYVFFESGQSSQFVEVYVYNDEFIEDIEDFTLEIVPGYEYDNYVVGNQDTTTVEIVDNSPTVEFGAVSYTLNEDQGATNPYDYPNGYTYVVELVRTGDLTNFSHVHLNVLEGTAIQGQDYEFYQNHVFFESGQSSQFVEVYLYNDELIEDIENFTLEILPGYEYDNYVVGNQDTTTVEIVDNSPTVEFGAVSYTLNEDQGATNPYDYPNGYTYVVELVRTGDLTNFSHVHLNVLEGTAIQGQDYEFYQNHVFFESGQSSQFVEVYLYNDELIEDIENFTLEILPGYEYDNYVVGNQDTTTVEIVDNSPTVEFGAVSYTLNEDQGATNPYDYPNGYTYVVELVRTGDLTNFSHVHLNVLEGTAIQGQDYEFYQNHVFFESGQSSQFVEVYLYNDELIEDIENFTLEILPGYEYDNYVVGNQDTTTVEIVDNSPTVEFGAVSYTLNEDQGATNPYDYPNGYTYVVELVRTGDLTNFSHVHLNVLEGTAIQGQDYEFYQNHVFFESGQSSQFVEVYLYNDELIEDIENFTLEILPGYEYDNYVVGNQDTTTVEIVDNSPTVEFGAVSYTLNEDQGATNPYDYPNGYTYVVELVRTGDLTNFSHVHLNVLEGTAIQGQDYEFYQNHVFFESGQSSQFVEVYLYNDELIEDIENFTLEILPGYEYDNYVVGNQDTTTVEIVDNSPTVEFGAVSYTLNEDQGATNPYDYPNGYTYVVELVRTGDLTNFSHVHLNVLEGTAIQGQDYEFYQNHVFFESGQSSQFVEVYLYNDELIEDIENFTLEILPGYEYDNYVVGNQDTTTVEIVDNSPTVEFGAVSYTLNEDQGATNPYDYPNGYTYVVELVRTGDLTNFSHVHLNVLEGTAIQGQDYEFYQNHVFFESGQSSQFVEVYLYNDELIEDIENFTLEILPGYEYDNYVVGNQDTTTVEIVDNSPTVEFGEVSYTLNEDQGTSMVVEVIRSGDLSFDSHVFLDAVGGDATLGSDYDFNNLVQFYAGESSKFVEINLLNDPEIEPTETIELEIIPGYGHDNYVVGTQDTTTVNIVDTSPTVEIVSDIPGVAITINDTLQTRTLESYGGSQDKPEAIVTYNDNGNEVTIEKNAWKDWSLGNYNITENTILNFEFRSPSQGEIQGIGFDNNESISGSTLFQLYGTQRWGNQAVNNQYSPTDDWKAYSIRVSDYFTGTFDRLVFTNDDDANLGGISQFRNIVLSEEVPTPTNTLPDTLTGLVTTETGTLDADIFVLGDENEAFYDTYGEQDYAEMIGFNAYQDTIQLHGVADDYYIGSSPSGSNDQGIFLQVPGMEDELVGIVKDTINLDLNSNNFVFV